MSTRSLLSCSGVRALLRLSRILDRIACSQRRRCTRSRLFVEGPVLLWISSYKRSGEAQGAVDGGGRGLNWRDRGWRVRLRTRGGVNSFDGVSVRTHSLRALAYLGEMILLRVSVRVLVRICSCGIRRSGLCFWYRSDILV